MTEEFAISLGVEAIQTMLFLSGPLLGAAMGVGIMVSIFQAVTQINESTLTFIPKILAVLLVLTLMGTWMLDVLQNYTVQILSHAGEWVR